MSFMSSIELKRETILLGSFLPNSNSLFQVVCVQQVLATLSEAEMESTEDTWGSSRNHGKAGGPRSQEATELVWEGHRCCWGRTD